MEIVGNSSHILNKIFFFSEKYMETTKPTGYVFDEMCMWHEAGSLRFERWVEPGTPWEHPDTKRRFHNLLNVTGMIENLKQVKARCATKEEILRFHTEEYVNSIIEQSNKRGGNASDDEYEHAKFAKRGYEIASISAGGVLAMVEELLVRKTIKNAYCLVRPPGHHAHSYTGMGFCIFNNVVLAAKHARHITEADGENAVKRVAIIDYDVHHGNGTQEAAWEDRDTLFISLHQDNNYPEGTGKMTDVGGLDDCKSVINIPLPPGSGTGAYEYAFDTVVIPSLYRFKPDLILVSSGFDASFADPLARMMLSSECYGTLTRKLMKAAHDLCDDRLIYAHEGGYSVDYVPFCGLAVIEALSGIECYTDASRTQGNISERVLDPYLDEVKGFAFQDCQPHQKHAIDLVAGIHDFVVENKEESELTATEQSVLNAISSVLNQSVAPDRKSKVIEAIVKHMQ